jgi:hypothetical protein
MTGKHLPCCAVECCCGEPSIDRGVLDVGMSQPRVTGVIEGKFTVSYNFLLIKRLRWPLPRCDTTDFAVQYGYIALSV